MILRGVMEWRKDGGERILLKKNRVEILKGNFGIFQKKDGIQKK